MLELGWGLAPFFALTLYIVSITVVILTIFYRIEIGIFFLTLFLPIQNVLDSVNVYPGGEDFNDFIIIAILIRWMLNKNKYGYVWKKSPLNIPIILWIAWTFFGTWNGSAYLAMPSPVSLSHPLLANWKNYIIPFILYFAIINNIHSHKTLQYLVLTMVFTTLVLDRNFYNVMLMHDTSHYSDDLKEKFLNTGCALSGNSLAVYLGQFATVFVAMAKFEKTIWRKVLYIFVSGLSYYCIMFLFSRSGYLAAAMGLLVIGMVMDRRIVIAIVALVLFWNTLLPTAVIERIEMTSSEEGFDDTSQQRFGMWTQAENMISERPLWGFGFGVTPYLDIRAGTKFHQSWGSFHNNFVQTTVETGFIGIGLTLFLFFMVMGLSLRGYYRSEDNFTKGVSIGTAAGVWAMLAGNIAGSYWHFFTIASHFWILAAIVIKCHELEMQKVAPTAITESQSNFVKVEQELEVVG